MVKCRSKFCLWLQRNMTNFVALILTTMICAMAYLALFDTNNPRTLESEARGEDGKAKYQFKAGDTLHIYRKFCVDRVVSGRADIEIIHKTTGEFHSLGTRPTGARKGCASRTSVIRLPPSLTPGIYQYRSTVQYDVNPLRMLIYALPEIEFEIIK